MELLTGFSGKKLTGLQKITVKTSNLVKNIFKVYLGSNNNGTTRFGLWEPTGSLKMHSLKFSTEHNLPSILDPELILSSSWPVQFHPHNSLSAFTGDATWKVI